MLIPGVKVLSPPALSQHLPGNFLVPGPLFYIRVHSTVIRVGFADIRAGLFRPFSCIPAFLPYSLPDFSRKPDSSSDIIYLPLWIYFKSR
jgi:hypothetical protein